MTISGTNSRNDYTAGGASCAFAFTFPITAETSLAVYVCNALVTNYSVTGAGSAAGGTITFSSVPIATSPVAILRAEPYTQALDLVEHGPMSADTLEQALDKLEMQIQQVREKLARTLVFQPYSLTCDITLPTPAKDQFLKWNSTATALENACSVTGSLSVANFTCGTFNVVTNVSGLTGQHRFGSGDVVLSATSPSGFTINPVITVGTNGSAWGQIVAANYITASSGTHPALAGTDLDFPHITTSSGAAITEIDAVRIGADGLPPYASATTVYALRVSNGIIAAFGGTAASASRPSMLVGNNMLIAWLDSAGVLTNGGFVWTDSSNNFKIGAGGTTRFTMASGGDITLTGSLTAGVNLAFSAANPRVLIGSGALFFFDSTNTTEYFRILGGGGIFISTAGSATTALLTPAGGTGASSIRLPHGAAPTSPVNGDMWTTTAGLFVRVNGSTVGPLS